MPSIRGLIPAVDAEGSARPRRGETRRESDKPVAGRDGARGGPGRLVSRRFRSRGPRDQEAAARVRGRANPRPATRPVTPAEKRSPLPRATGIRTRPRVTVASGIVRAERTTVLSVGARSQWRRTPHSPCQMHLPVEQFPVECPPYGGEPGLCALSGFDSWCLPCKYAAFSRIRGLRASLRQKEFLNI